MQDEYTSWAEIAEAFETPANQRTETQKFLADETIYQAIWQLYDRKYISEDTYDCMNKKLRWLAKKLNKPVHRLFDNDDDKSRAKWCRNFANEPFYYML